MRTLTIQGWNIGFQKVEFTKMLQRELGFMLTDAKNVVDSIIAKQRVEFQIENEKYDHVSKLATKLGAIVLPAHDIEE